MQFPLDFIEKKNNYYFLYSLALCKSLGKDKRFICYTDLVETFYLHTTFFKLYRKIFSTYTHVPLTACNILVYNLEEKREMLYS